MGLLDDMAVHLVASGVGTLWAGTNNGTTTYIFKGIHPDTPHRSVAIIALPGTAPMETFGEDSQPIIARPAIQVFTRHDPDDYQSAETLAFQVYRALNLVANETVNGSFYQHVQPTSDPAPFDRDSQRRVVFVSNHSVWRTPQ